MRRAIAAAAVMALALTACGGGGGDSGDAPATTTPTTQAFAGDEGNPSAVFRKMAVRDVHAASSLAPRDQMHVWLQVSAIARLQARLPASALSRITSACPPPRLRVTDR